METKLYVGNLSHDLDNSELRNVFQQYGEVVSAQIIMDRDTGRSKGFGFVEMEDEAAGDEAVRQLNDSPFLNRPLRVSRARQEQGGGPRQGRSGGGYGGQRGGDERRPSRRPHYEEAHDD